MTARTFLALMLKIKQCGIETTSVFELVLSSIAMIVNYLKPKVSIVFRIIHIGQVASRGIDLFDERAHGTPHTCSVIPRQNTKLKEPQSNIWTIVMLLLAIGVIGYCDHINIAGIWLDNSSLEAKQPLW